MCAIFGGGVGECVLKCVCVLLYREGCEFKQMKGLLICCNLIDVGGITFIR